MHDSDNVGDYAAWLFLLERLGRIYTHDLLSQEGYSFSHLLIRACGFLGIILIQVVFNIGNNYGFLTTSISVHCWLWYLPIWTTSWLHFWKNDQMVLQSISRQVEMQSACTSPRSRTLQTYEITFNYFYFSLKLRKLTRFKELAWSTWRMDPIRIKMVSEWSRYAKKLNLANNAKIRHDSRRFKKPEKWNMRNMSCNHFKLTWFSGSTAVNDPCQSYWESDTMDQNVGHWEHWWPLPVGVKVPLRFHRCNNDCDSNEPHCISEERVKARVFFILVRFFSPAIHLMPVQLVRQEDPHQSWHLVDDECVLKHG